jgi:hypothetical protein
VAHAEKTQAVRSEPFDFASLRSGRTETESTASEEVCESRVARFRPSVIRLWRFSVGICLVLVSLCSSATQGNAAGAGSWFDLSRWRDPGDWPFILLPEVATDPNGGEGVAVFSGIEYPF